jgi:hypothetical protein
VPLTQFSGLRISQGGAKLQRRVEAGMIKKIAIGVVCIAFVLFVALFGVVLFILMSTSTSTGATLASGRSVNASVDSFFIAMETNNNTATVRTIRHTVVVTPTNLQVDGRLIATIAPSTQSVDVAINDGEVTFIADGQTISGSRY